MIVKNAELETVCGITSTSVRQTRYKVFASCPAFERASIPHIICSMISPYSLYKVRISGSPSVIRIVFS